MRPVLRYPWNVSRSANSVQVLKEERLAVRTETASQVKACLNRGLRPTQLESHHQVHTECTIGAVAITIARQDRMEAI